MVTIELLLAWPTVLLFFVKRLPWRPDFCWLMLILFDVLRYPEEW